MASNKTRHRLVFHFRFRNKYYICHNNKIVGVPYFQAEIKPYEPDAGNAAVGNCS